MLKSIPFFASLLNQQIDEKLKSTLSHVLVYGAVEAHDMGKLGCIASNETIAQETGLTKSTVEKTLSQLNKARWISVKMKNGKRVAIIPLLEISIPLLHSKGGFTGQKDGVYSTVNIDNNIDSSKENTSEKSLVPELIDLFKEVNDAYKSFFANKTERKNAEDLLKIHSFEEIRERIGYVKQYNRLPFLSRYDKVYKPSDLFRNWSVMEDNLVSLRNTKNSKTLEEVG